MKYLKIHVDETKHYAAQQGSEADLSNPETSFCSATNFPGDVSRLLHFLVPSLLTSEMIS